MSLGFDIDIDLPNRDAALALIKHHPAGIITDGKVRKHNTGIHICDIPVDPVLGCATIDYLDAEERNYVKLDLLNVSVYQSVKSETHLVELMNKEPQWEKLYDRDFCSRLTHIGNHYDTLIKCQEKVDSIPRLAMFIAVIRPAKRHLIGKPWKDIAKTVWDKPADGEYYFKKSHSCGYATLIVVHMNLLCEGD